MSAIMSSVKCPYCNHPLTFEELADAQNARPTKADRSAIAKTLGRLGGLKGAGGRPLSKKKRCPCGANTFTRAKARAFDCCKKAGVVPR